MAYGKLQYRASIIKKHGHGVYDVQYEKATFGGHNSAALMSRFEASVHVDRITPLNSVHRVKKFGYSILPFVCIPLRHRGKGIGVLGVDNFSTVPIAPYEEPPEPGLLVFLEQFGKSLGTYIDIQRKKASLGILSHVTRNINATHHEVFDVAFQSVRMNLCFCTGITAARVLYEQEIPEAQRGVHVMLSSGRPAASTEPLLRAYDPHTMSLKSLQKKNDHAMWLIVRLRPDKRGGEGKIFVVVVEQNPMEDKSVRAVLEAKHRHDREEEEQAARVATLKLRMDGLKERQALKDAERVAEEAKADASKPGTAASSSSRPASRPKSRSKKQRLEDEEAAKKSKVAEEKKKKADELAKKQKKEREEEPEEDYTRFDWTEPDIEYLEQLQKLLLGSIQSVDTRKAKDQVRFEALRDIKETCADFGSRPREEIFYEVVEAIQTCYFSANVYVGLLGAQNRNIEYILSSEASRMAGKKLTRKMKSVTFDVFDQGRKVVVPHVGDDMAERLFHFGLVERFEFPYVAVPLIAFLDSPMAVLGVDAAYELSAAGGDDGSEEAVSFINTVAAYFSDAVRGYRLADAYRELDRIVKTGKNFRESLRDIKKLLMSVVPFTVRVSELVYEPLVAPCMVGRKGDIVSKEAGLLVEDIVILVKVLKVACYVAGASNPTIKCSWQDKLYLQSKVSDTMTCKAFMLRASKGAPLTKASLLVELKATVKGFSKDLCRHKIDLSYFTMAPANEMEHFLMNNGYKEYRVGSLHFASKSFSMEEAVGFSLANVKVKGLLRATEKDEEETQNDVAMKTYVIVRWRGLDIITSDATDGRTLTYSNLRAYGAIKAVSFDDDVFEVEVWEQVDMTNQNTLLSYLRLTGMELEAELAGGGVGSAGRGRYVLIVVWFALHWSRLYWQLYVRPQY